MVPTKVITSITSLNLESVSRNGDSRSTRGSLIDATAADAASQTLSTAANSVVADAMLCEDGVKALILETAVLAATKVGSEISS